jgi:hypothetical protein
MEPDRERREQRRGRRLAMTPADVDAFLEHHRTCRVATLSVDGPHVSPMWFHWDGQSLWLNSVVGSQRWVDCARDPRVAVVIDDGTEFSELRGVEIKGRAAVVGEVPRIGEPDPELDRIDAAFHRKYRDPSAAIPYDGKHAWLRVTPTKITSWDFQKLQSKGRALQ